jgi:hypothetical protein
MFSRWTLVHTQAKHHGAGALLHKCLATIVLGTFLTFVVVPDSAWARREFKPGYPNLGEAFDEIEDDGRQRLLVGTLITLGVIGVVVLSIALAKKSRRRAGQARTAPYASPTPETSKAEGTPVGELPLFKW